MNDIPTFQFYWSHEGRYIGLSPLAVDEGYYVKVRGKWCRRAYKPVGFDDKFRIVWVVNPFWRKPL